MNWSCVSFSESPTGFDMEYPQLVEAEQPLSLVEIKFSCLKIWHCCAVQFIFFKLKNVLKNVLFLLSPQEIPPVQGIDVS